MAKFIHHLQKFFTTENPLLIPSFLLLILFSRFIPTYFNDAYRVMTPDANYYAGQTLGHDFIFGVTDQAYRLLSGLPMQFEVGYGYTFTILGAFTIQLLSIAGICNQNHIPCQFLLYKLVTILALAGLVSLVFFIIKDRGKQATGLTFLIAFLLGVPGGMGIEAGNLDIILSVLYGFMLYLQKMSLTSKSRLYPLMLGIMAGAMLQTKLFVLPIVVIFLICSTSPLIFLTSLLTTIGVITILPGMYGVPINPLYTIQAAHTLQRAANFSSGIVYGNNNTRAMIGGIVFAFPVLNANQSIRWLLVNVGGLLLFLFIMVLPFFSFPKVYKRIVYILQHRFDYSYFTLLNCFIIAAVILWPEISLSYRLFYLIPLIFTLLNSAQNTFTKNALGFALSALLIRSLFLWHARVLHIFLLVFFYFFLLTCLSLWSPQKVLKKHKAG